jgi:hypothetical protein
LLLFAYVTATAILQRQEETAADVEDGSTDVAKVLSSNSSEEPETAPRVIENKYIVGVEDLGAEGPGEFVDSKKSKVDIFWTSFVPLGEATMFLHHSKLLMVVYRVVWQISMMIERANVDSLIDVVRLSNENFSKDDRLDVLWKTSKVQWPFEDWKFIEMAPDRSDVLLRLDSKSDHLHKLFEIFLTAYLFPRSR